MPDTLQKSSERVISYETCLITQPCSLDKIVTFANHYKLSRKNLVDPTRVAITIIDIGTIGRVQQGN